MNQTIRDFINSNKSRSIDWNSSLYQAGYFSIPAGRISVRNHWNEMHQWCKSKFGESHYCWTGSTFWFETKDDAMVFALRWS
jgi:hypothetical protein